MNGLIILEIVALPIAFAAGRFSVRYRFMRIKRRYKQNVGEFIRGR